MLSCALSLRTSNLLPVLTGPLLEALLAGPGSWFAFPAALFDCPGRPRDDPECTEVAVHFFNLPSALADGPPAEADDLLVIRTNVLPAATGIPPDEPADKLVLAVTATAGVSAKDGILLDKGPVVLVDSV